MRAARYATWRDGLSRADVEELLAIKTSLLAGDLGVSARSLAKAILDDYQKHGVRLCSLHTLSQWLLQK